MADEVELDARPRDRLGVYGVFGDPAPLLAVLGSPQEVADAVADAVAAGEPDNHTVVAVDLS